MKEVIDKIFNNEDYKMVYFELGKYLNTNEYKEKRKLQNELFIKYLQEKHPQNINHLYEKMAMKMSTIRYTDEILIYLLNNNLDLSYSDVDMFKTPFILEYYLATNIKSHDVMQVYLKKVSPNLIYFGNGHYRSYTDLCRMNIIAGDKEKALEVFQNSNYNLINIDYTSDLKIIEFFKQRDDCNIDSLGFAGFIEHDMLYQIVITIKESDLVISEKRDMLKSFIYHDKVKLFNAGTLTFIQEILSDNEYQEFIDYLNLKINSNQIVLFDVFNRNNIYLVKLDNGKIKKLER